jgi:hypothetical protein
MTRDELIMLEARGWDEAQLVFGQRRTDLRRFQILAANCQDRSPTRLRNVVEDVVSREQSQGSFIIQSSQNTRSLTPHRPCHVSFI